MDRRTDKEDGKLAMKNNEILPFAATQMNLEIIILNEAEKDNFMISFICAI